MTEWKEKSDVDPPIPSRRGECREATEFPFRLENPALRQFQTNGGLGPEENVMHIWSTGFPCQGLGNMAVILQVD